ncbi:MAG: spore maturation protein A, partial [Eubacteriales bacterium]
MLGKVFAILVLSAFLCGGVTGNMAAVCRAALDGANEAVTLSLSLLGIMCLWSGVIRALDKAGLTKLLSKAVAPLLRLIYPTAYRLGTAVEDIAADYSANLLGLGNAALPIGMRAMCSLKKNGLPAPDT